MNTGSSKNSHTIAVLGAGSWGTALAMMLGQNKHNVNLWSHNAEHAALMQKTRENTRYLANLTFPETLNVSSDFKIIFNGVTDILVVVPSHAFRQTLENIKPFLTNSHRVAWATKGLEAGSYKLLHQVAREVLGDEIPLAVISGPTFAKEVAQGLPGAVTVASDDQILALNWANLLHNDHFRAYTGEDVIGVELGGACKNVIAIAAGIADGMGFGALSEEAQISLAKGAELAGTGFCSGECGMLPEEQEANTRYFYELASAGFGYKEELLSKVQAFHFKGGQGAKTGTGGHLPGNKNKGKISKVRGIPEGQPAISPPTFRNLSSSSEFKRFADRVREITGGIPIGFKLSANHIEKDIQFALDASADYIILDGRGGGTGAAPDRKSTRLNSSHTDISRMPSSA